MAVNDIKKIYHEVIADVCSAVREALSEEGYDEHTLQELRTLWGSKLENSRALEPIPVSAVEQATTRDFRHPAAGDTNNTTTLNNLKQQGASRYQNAHQVTNTVVQNYNTQYASATTLNGVMTNQSIGTNFTRMNVASVINPTILQTNTMKASNQIDGANDEIIYEKLKKKKKSNVIEISLQLDGTGPQIGDDDDDDDDSEVDDNDVGDDVDDDDDDDANEGGKEDPNPLCSDDDVSDDDPNELFDADNVVVCQYDKISRTKNKWRFTLKSGVMNIDGRDYLFSKASGDADW